MSYICLELLRSVALIYIPIFTKKEFIFAYYKHCSVIDEDLRVWEEKGISRENIEAAKPRGAHYQIINHKLYRENDCMFPARFVSKH